MGTDKNSQCIVYITDEIYFFPTFVSALQARRNSRETTDVIIIVTEVFQQAEAAQSCCRDNGIVFLDSSAALSQHFSRLDRRNFLGRITISTVGRLLLSEILPPQYKQIIYIDGDTQIVDILNPLEDTHVSPGKFLAALDYSALTEVVSGNRPRPYFNPGVLKFNRDGWIGPQAFEYLMKNNPVDHDQGSLNAVAGDALILISNRWNFPKQFLHLLGNHRPAIVHYMAHPKPWDGAYFPWGRRESRVYDMAVKDNPQLAVFRHQISFLRKIAYRWRSVRSRFAERTNKNSCILDPVMIDTFSEL